MKYLIERAGEASTWRGAFFLLTAIGVTVRPDMQEAIVSAGMAVAGLVGLITRDKAA